ncbi:TIGR02186 family protein [Aurantimonas sp. MSK8Z-1]|uniref:TIGR02186 family protein n=1 Tax=Mangrovibrevibacter kandeliae TaxID=2968473 RepID=UPI002119AD2D|nr:TIGR02186 family protein [Aurantimonas sp. MSK8Z-1]MCW4116965.1 TIGR02186 family protein [Aurantimonas sp. MSK8Z-1]
MRAMVFGLLLVVALLTAGRAALAQSPETFEIGLSTDSISITSDFAGERLVIFGSLDNADQKILRQGGYDIIVVLEGPRRPAVVREKDRVLGLWINRGSESFETAPSSYALASTRALRDISGSGILEQLGIGIDNLRLGFNRVPGTASPNRDQYAAALRRLRGEEGLYRETTAAVQFVSPSLFRAELALPAALPVGQHLARAFLFRRGEFLRERSEPLWVRKAGFENWIFEFSKDNGFVYGILAVALAIFTGWFGRLAFKRD